MTRLAQITPKVTIQTGSEFWDQWQTEYLAWAFPFSIPSPVGGPDFPNKDRPRRKADAAVLGPVPHLRSLARRIESSLRNSWDLISGLRRLTFKWHSVCQAPLYRAWRPKTNALQATPAHEWVEAAKALYQKLQKGKYLTAGKTLKPINYDARKLWFAEGLTAPEAQLLRDIRHAQMTLPGTVEVRRRIGRFLFGARVELGEPIFMTLSPTTRHNALCLRLSRYRQHDPGAGPLAGKHVPRVWEEAEVILPVPDYETRRQTSVRDPWAVDIAFQSMVRFVFAELLGLRICFRCPNCSCRDSLGQSTHPMGGILGLVLGFCGAIEYQKNSNPHFHANVYVATVWQQPLKKLAEKIRAKAVTLEELFQYQAWLHNESHFNLQQHEALFPALEKQWMQNFPGTEHDKLCLWPAFVATDTTPSPWLHPQAAECPSALPAPANPADLQTDAARYRQLYQTAVQVKLSHQQHHMHSWDPKHKCYVPLPACQKKDAPNKCKHGFPKTLCDVARVVCRGNARKFRQSTAGRRNALGCVLNPRDNQWLSGTMHAFTLMFMGNSHTGINFRIPLLPETHDPACERNCLATETLQRLQRLMQHAAKKATQYFTGYLQKPQPLGRKELQQAAKHLSYLDITPAKGEEAKHYRKVLHRVCGDLEFRCSVRPLTEEVMLAGFWDGDEPTSAECIRSFAVVPFVGSDWLAQHDKATEVRHRVKPTHHRQAHLKSSDLYGWRGQDPRLRYLSPWEFTALWEVQRLQPPSHQKSDLSEWLPGCGAGPEPADGWQFGRDYRWKQHIPAENPKNIVPLPSRASTAAGADHYFVRRAVPLVPYPTACPLPKADMSKDQQARLLNIYLRPWTLAGDDATVHVPHIKALDMAISDRQKKPAHRCVGKTSVGHRSHHSAWNDYIRHHIVSANAARTISNFLAAAECSPDDVEEATVEEAKKPDREVDTSWVDMTTVQRLTAGEGFQYSKRSAQTVQSLVHDWTTSQTSSSNQGPRQFSTGLPDPGPAPATGAAGTDPFAQQTQPPRPVATNYGTFQLTAARTWLRALNMPGTTPAPNQEQKQVLTAVVERCHAEAVEERADKENRSEPLRAILHGVPGAGKSQTLHWLRTFFETVCDWQHLHEFAFVAPQNTQAALIDGITIHSFADIRVQGKKQKKETAFGPDQFVKYQHLRWLIIDECSTAALEVLAVLEKRLQEAVRAKHSWKCRTTGTPRPFAGINILLAGDCWQFPAVKATSIFHNPFKHGQSVQVANLQKVLWAHDRAHIQQLFELTQEHRCVDPWLSAILHAARHGAVTQEQWAFLHGFPTLHAGSWDPHTDKCSCKKAACNALAKQWTKEVLDPKSKKTWQDRRQAECDVCAAERRRRCIVAGASDLGPNPKNPKFLQAPFVHGLNAAKYVAALLRARWVAAEQQHLLLWVVAQDTPLFHTDPDTEAQELQHRKEQWLQRHDQATAGIMGLLPLLPGMPIRITQTLPELKPLGLFKNTRGHLFGWSLADEDIAAIPACQQPELVLQKMPACLFVAIPGATWQHRPGLPPGVACIRPVVQHWKLEAHGTATVARRGFPLACDYAGTAHSFMGATLAACSLDLGFWDTVANRDSQLSAYMCLSRVKKAEDLCIARPFSPNLLSQGELIGPDTFLAVHRQTLTLADAKSKFEQEHVQRKRNPETLFFCRGCTPKAKSEHGLLPLRDFTSNNLWQPDAWLEIVCLGMERLCSQCRHPQPSKDPTSAETDASSKCAFCNKTPLPKLGFCKKCMSEARLACARCDVGRKLKPKTLADFSPAEIQRRTKHRDLRRACCMKCERLQPNKSKAKAGQCRTCRNVVSVSHLHQYDSKANDGVCRKCWRKATDLEAATAKVCPQCSTPLKPAATPGSWCQTCAFPPCAGCQKVKRPTGGAYHAKNRPVWLCPACKVCSQCGQPVQGMSKLGTWCQSCAYPPCAGCQQVARPGGDHAYHAKHRPFWRCAQCARESCPMCQVNPLGQDAGGGPDAACPQCAERGPKCAACKQPMRGRPHSHGWCHGCAFPPCAGGCGTPRPSRSGKDKDKYHAKLMPEWTCQPCQLSQS